MSPRSLRRWRSTSRSGATTCSSSCTPARATWGVSSASGAASSRRSGRSSAPPAPPRASGPTSTSWSNRPLAAADLELGRVARPHGIRGEVVVMLHTDRPERTAPGAVLRTGDRTLIVASARPHQGRWLVRFEGITDRNGAEELRGATLVGEPLDDPGEGRIWVHELVGEEVRDVRGNTLGRVTGVEANPAHDLLVLDDGTLVPYVFVVDQQPGVLVVDLPDGLLDVNR